MGVIVTQDRLKFSQWVLERNLQWIASADVKTAIIVAVSTGMLGGLGSEFGSTPLASHGHCANVLALAAAACLTSAILCAAMTVFPRVRSEQLSLIFAGAIARAPSAEFAMRFLQSTDDELLRDCLLQIHRNASIADQKFSWVRTGVTSGLLGVPFWVLALAMLPHR